MEILTYNHRCKKYTPLTFSLYNLSDKDKVVHLPFQLLSRVRKLGFGV